MFTNQRWTGTHDGALRTRAGVPRPEHAEVRDGAAPKATRGRNPFVAWKPERQATVASELMAAEDFLRPASEAASPYEEGERRRIARAWNGLQLPL